MFVHRPTIALGFAFAVLIAAAGMVTVLQARRSLQDAQTQATHRFTQKQVQAAFARNGVTLTAESRFAPSDGGGTVVAYTTVPVQPRTVGLQVTVAGPQAKVGTGRKLRGYDESFENVEAVYSGTDAGVLRRITAAMRQLQRA